MWHAVVLCVHMTMGPVFVARPPNIVYFRIKTDIHTRLEVLSCSWSIHARLMYHRVRSYILSALCFVSFSGEIHESSTLAADFVGAPLAFLLFQNTTDNQTVIPGLHCAAKAARVLRSAFSQLLRLPSQISPLPSSRCLPLSSTFFDL